MVWEMTSITALISACRMRSSASWVLQGAVQGLMKGGEEEEWELMPEGMSVLHGVRVM